MLTGSFVSTICKRVCIKAGGLKLIGGGLMRRLGGCTGVTLLLGSDGIGIFLDRFGTAHENDPTWCRVCRSNRRTESKRE